MRLKVKTSTLLLGAAAAWLGYSFWKKKGLFAPKPSGVGYMPSYPFPQ